MSKWHHFRSPSSERKLKQPDLPSQQGGWGTIIFMIFIVFMISKCSDHHDNRVAPGYLPPMPGPPDEGNPPMPHDGEPILNNLPYLPLPENHVPPSPHSPPIRANGSENTNLNWYVPNENIGSENRPPTLPTDEREPSWIIPKEENQRAP